MDRKFLWIMSIFFIVFIGIKSISGFYIDYEWFKANQGLQVFWVMFLTKFKVHALFSVIFVGLFLLNFLLIRILGGEGRIFTPNFLDRIKIPAIGSSRNLLAIIVTLAIVFLGFIMGGTASAFWKEYIVYKNAVPFTGFPVDPIFGMDPGFFVFSLPFYNFLYGWLMSSLLMITAFSFVLHLINGGISIHSDGFEFSLFCRAHLSILLAMVVVLFGLSYRLSAYELLLTNSGKFFGAGYTAVNASLLAFRAAEIISFIAGALLLFNVFKKSFKLPVIVLLTIIPVYFVLGVIFPSLQQRFIVEPNELDKEKEYIENNIKFTRLAYGLNKIVEIPFENNRNLTFRDISKNKDTLDSVRLWDWRPLKQSYKQLQELKQYYFFNDVDVDRYMINNKKIAVNLSARELSLSDLRGGTETWQNKHLIYTHGYGVVMSRVDQKSTEGQPVMLIKDIPPKSEIDIKIDRPEIYYGEHTNPYVVTNTTIKPGEFDYPFGEENRYTTYEGTGGIKLDSLFKRLLAAVSFGDINLLISSNITNESRLLFRRNVVEIAKNYAPFLELENDPYLVISEGKLYWFIDAYTVSNQFPYSTPIRAMGKTFNFIRNSVKIVIDAYNGEINCYISDPSDPMIQAYAKILPGIFKSMEEMPEPQKAHVRYPETIFNVQSHMLLKYHMDNANVFYNNEDLWDIPKQIYENREEDVQSYYLVTTLPNEKNSEFIMIIPFTPVTRDNMLSFLTAKCDMPDYGQLQLYQLPKDKLSYGPMQIEARINQDPEISKQLALWNQQGSSVIRGNMMVIPIEESVIFIEPLYLKARTSEMPELQQVILAFADKIVMEKDLPSALEKLFYQGSFTEERRDAAERNEKELSLKDLANRAHTHFTRAEESIKNGDWKKYGEELSNLREILNIMKNASK